MGNSDLIITNIKNEAVMCSPDGQTIIIDIKAKDKFINRLNNIVDQHEMSNWNEVAHLLREGWLMSNTYIVDLLGEAKLYEYLSMYNLIMMEDDEIRFLADLHDEVIVYRGSNCDIDSKLSSLSWIWSIDIATVYAVNRKGHVFEGKVNKENILCVLFDEKEYIIKPNTVKITEKITWKEAVDRTGISVFYA